MSLEPFAYHRARGLADALSRLAAPGAVALAGGTDVLPLWRAGALQPRTLVDLRDLGLAEIEADDRRLVLGAMTRLSDVSGHPTVRALWPGIVAAIEVSASPQIRNLATVGGNLMQRTRCPYFRSLDLPCNRRAPGTGCGAREGLHRHAAIFGTSAACVASHASDLAVALMALDATVRIATPAGERRRPLSALWRSPNAGDAGDTALAAGELIVAVEVAAPAPRSAYRKVRDRASFEFAVVSVAATLVTDNGRIVRAGLAAGGVGAVPWRLPACEAALMGARAGFESFRKAASLAPAGAEPLPGNAFKAELLKRTIVRALAEAAHLGPEDASPGC